MPKLLDRLRFKDNPFASYVAENEPSIESYFIRPPYFDDVASRGFAARSIILFGARGAGKSATRLTFYRECWARWQRNEPAPLAIVLDDYSRIVPSGVDKVELGAFVAEIGYLTVEAVLVWLSALEEADREDCLASMNEDEESRVIAIVQRFYLSRPELVRSATVREPLKLLNQAWHKRTRLWIDKKWDSVATLISSIAAGIAKKATSIEGGLDSGLRDLLKSDPTQWNADQFARALLSRFSEFAGIFGFHGLVVLVDKADETRFTSNSAAATARMLFPILSTTQLLEIDRFGWLLFLWDKVQEPYASTELPVRLDKIAHATIRWEERYLQDLISKRLAYFSEDRVMSFADMCDASVQSIEVLRNITALCMNSPRELIRVLDTVIREHDEVFSSIDDAPLLILESVDRALDKYTIETLPRLYSGPHLQQIVRMSVLIFTNREVQNTFKINDQSARARIRAWEDAGMVSKTGTRPAEGGVAGKPANEYSILDQRVRRLLERQLSLGAGFDAAVEDEPGG